MIIYNLIKLNAKITKFIIKLMVCIVLAPIWFIIGMIKKD